MVTKYFSAVSYDPDCYILLVYGCRGADSLCWPGQVDSSAYPKPSTHFNISEWK